jgi:branched-chain amino acid aminotransferase
MFAFVDSEIVPLKKAFLHVSDLSIQRGYGVFDFFKIYEGHAYFLNEYLDRFFQSASILRLPVPLEREKLIHTIYYLIERNNLKESGMKMILTGGYSQDGYQPHHPNLIITQQALSLPQQEQLETGVSIITHEYVREIPGAKTINYTMGIWLAEKVKDYNAYDVLYHKDGLVSEFPRSNFFMVDSDNTVITPQKNILEGVTRKNILVLASKRYKVEERDVTLSEVFHAKEAFITSTTKRIVPIVTVDGKPIGNEKPGEVSRDLCNMLIELEKEDKKSNQKNI